MMLRSTLLVLACATATAVADGKREDRIVDDALARVRDHLANQDLTAARALLLDTYAKHPRPDLLFALGQVELNLGNYAEAIDYYERFLATNPSSEQAALAQQAIGAARGLADQPAPATSPPTATTPPPPRLVRDWDGLTTALVVIGGTAALAGGGVAGYGYHLGRDRSGTLSDYDARLDRSRTLQRAGVAISAGGALVIGAALVRWGVRRVEVAPVGGPEVVGLALGHRW